MLSQRLQAVEVLRSEAKGKRVRAELVLESCSWCEPVAGCKAAGLGIRNGMPLTSP